MRELELFRQHLEKQRARHLSAGHKIASSCGLVSDHTAIVAHAKCADAIAELLLDLKALDQDSGEFVKRFLQ